MALPVYSRRFIASHAGTLETFTVPAGYTAVLLTITAFNASLVTEENAQLVLQPANVTLWQDTVGVSGPGASGPSDVVRMYVVVNEGETILTSSGSDIDMTVSGYLLTALP